MGATALVTDTSGLVIEHCFQIGDDPGAAKKTPPPPVVQAAPVPLAKPAVVTTATADGVGQVSLKQVLRQLKDRLRVVDREIKSRRALEKERDQIRRLIAATTQEQSNLRRIRAAG